MTSLDDLKDTLARAGAAAPSGIDTSARLTAVNRRVAMTRRRRAGAVSLAAAAAVALAVTGVNGLLPSRQSAPGPSGTAQRALGDLTAPETLTSLGYTYRFQRGVHDADRVDLKLTAADQPRLVSWGAAAAGEPRLGLVDENTGEIMDHPVPAESFTDFLLVAPGEEFTARLSEKVDAVGDVALAVYTLSDPLPEGVGRAGIVFRSQAQGDRLLGASVGKAGQDSVTFDVTVPKGARQVRFSVMCSGDGAASYNVIVDGEQMLSTGTCSDPSFDPGGQGGYSFPGKEWAGKTLRVTVVADTSRVGDFTGRLAAGAYSVATGDPYEVEYAGHTWQLLDRQQGTIGDAGIALPPGVADRLLVRYTVRAEGNFAVQLERDGQATSFLMGIDELTTLGDVLWPGEAKSVGVGPEEQAQGPLTKGEYEISLYQLSQ